MVEAVTEVPISSQSTTVPFNSLFTELITSVEINGELARAEVLMVINVVEFTLISVVCRDGSSVWMKIGPYSTSVPSEFLAMKVHLKIVPLTLMQVSSSGSSAWQTWATDPGNKVTVVPVHACVTNIKEIVGAWANSQLLNNIML